VYCLLNKCCGHMFVFGIAIPDVVVCKCMFKDKQQTLLWAHVCF
jgi:hypothetical protein